MVVHIGDGGAYAEGLEHLIFAARRNVDITVIVHDNGVYGLTVGQAGPMTPPGFKGRSTPYGSETAPFNPLELLYVAGATWLGRGYTHGIEQLKRLYKEAILHRGFSLVDTLQVCVTFRNMYESYNGRVYEVDGHDPRDERQALAKIREWDYLSDGPVALGTLAVRERPVFGEHFAAYGAQPVDVEAGVRGGVRRPDVRMAGRRYSWRRRTAAPLTPAQAVQLGVEDLDELMVAAHAQDAAALETFEGAAERLGHSAEARRKLALAGRQPDRLRGWHGSCSSASASRYRARRAGTGSSSSSTRRLSSASSSAIAPRRFTASCGSASRRARKARVSKR